MTARYAVRYWFIENGREVHLDEGPWDHFLAECVLVGTNATGMYPRIPALNKAVPLTRARIIRAEEAEL